MIDTTSMNPGSPEDKSEVTVEENTTVTEEITNDGAEAPVEAESVAEEVEPTQPELPFDGENADEVTSEGEQVSDTVEDNAVEEASQADTVVEDNGNQIG